MIGGVKDQRVQLGTDGHDDHIDRNLKVGAFLDDWFSSAGGIRFTEFHLHAFDGSDVAVFITEDLNRIVQKLEDDAFFHRVMYFLRSGRKLREGSSVDDVNLRSAHTFRASCRVHGNVAAADDGNLVTVHDRCIVFRQISLHQVDTRQIFVRRANADVVFARNVHEGRKSRACADEYGFIAAFLHQLINRKRTSRYRVRHEFHALGFKLRDFLRYDLFWQTELRDPVNQYAAGLVQRFVNGNLIALVYQIARAGKSRRACADDGNFVTVAFHRFDFFITEVRRVPVRDEAFQSADRNRFALLAVHAFALALIFLRADTSADCRQGAVLSDNLVSCFKISLCHLLDEQRNLNIDRTSGHARFLAAS